ncbi:MAG: DUF1499 domain-containing protein [Candidatus Eiseniibacteriota bacterium]
MADDFPVDFKTLRLSGRPNQWLALPPGFAGATAPHAESPVFPVAPRVLIQAVKQLATEEPRTALVRGDAGTGQAEFVARSRVFRFPDRITAGVFAVAGAGERSALAIWSRAVYGRRDFGVNRARVERWLDLLVDRLGRA